MQLICERGDTCYLIPGPDCDAQLALGRPCTPFVVLVLPLPSLYILAYTSVWQRPMPLLFILSVHHIHGRYNPTS